MSSNRLLRGIFGPKMDEVTGERKNCIMKSYSSPSIIRAIKERRMNGRGM
jgi:hypothetical protein